MFYTKYRPQKFRELFGLESVARTLLNELATGKLAHAYLFYGPRGTGKTTTARLLAKAINCEKVGYSAKHQLPNSPAAVGPRFAVANVESQTSSSNGEPCGGCETCRAIQNGRFLDLIEIDAASNRGIDDIRSLRDKIRLVPSAAKFKVYIIDEVHMLTTEAFNALLKTLEEPPAHALFILCTTEKRKVPETIRSRCQQFEFRRAASDDIVKKLESICAQEKIGWPKEKLLKIAKLSEGGYRDAETILEQAVSGNGEIDQLASAASPVAELAGDIIENRTKEALLLINRLYQQGANLPALTQELIEYWHNLLLILAGVEEIVEAETEELATMSKQCARLSRDRLVVITAEFESAYTQLKSTVIPTLPLELAIIKLTEKDLPPLAIVESELDREKEVAESVKVVKVDRLTISQSEIAPIHEEGQKLDWELVTAKWEELLKAIRPYNHSLEALMRSAKPKVVDGGKLQIEVLYKFHKDRLEEKKNQDILEKVLAEVYGRPVHVSCLLTEKSGNKP